MANIPLNSIKFPGLDDTYTIPQIDSTLAINGNAADAKVTGDALNNLTQVTDDIKTNLYRYEENNPNYAIGGINGNTGKANALEYRLRCSFINLYKYDKIINTNTTAYSVYLYKYDNDYTYIDRTFINTSEYTITENAYYKLMINRTSGSESFTTQEAEACSNIIYFYIKHNKINDKADETELDNKVNLPTTNKYGSSGDLLSSNGNGTTTWIQPGQPSQELIEAAINTWMEEHPEASMGFVNPLAFGAVGNGVVDDTVAIQDAINYAVENNLPVVDGMGKTYVVSGAVYGPLEEIKDSRINYGMYLHGNLIFRNFCLKLKDETDTQLTSVLNVYNNTDEKIIIENIKIDGNRSNQNSVPSGVGQDGGFHGIRVGFTHDCGTIVIDNCDIQNCYTDGIVIRPLGFTMMKINNCIIKGNGRNGITDNAKDSCVESCMIIENGTRTAPKSGYHIEPDLSCDFGTKKLINCVIKNNVLGDFKVYFNTKTFNVNLLEIGSCEIGSISWGNHGTTSDYVHKNIKIHDSVVRSISYGNGNDVTALNKFELYEISNTRAESISISGGKDYTSDSLIMNSVCVDGYVSVNKINKIITSGCRFNSESYSMNVGADVSNIIFANNTITNTGNSIAVDFGDCENVVCIGNISDNTENNTFNTSSVTSVQKANNIFA